VLLLLLLLQISTRNKSYIGRKSAGEKVHTFLWFLVLFFVAPAGRSTFLFVAVVVSSVGARSSEGARLGGKKVPPRKKPHRGSELWVCFCHEHSSSQRRDYRRSLGASAGRDAGGVLDFSLSPVHATAAFSLVCSTRRVAARGQTGDFDPMSSLWPKTAADFAFSQDCGEGPGGFLGRERGGPAAEAEFVPGDSARTNPLDEVRGVRASP